MIWLNGEIRQAEGAISANDRGLLLGEAAFETLVVQGGVPQFWDAHMARLTAACAAFSFPMPYDGETLKEGARKLLASFDSAQRQVLRLTVTGGASGRGLVPLQESDGTWLMQVSEATSPPLYLRLHESDVTVLAGGTSSQHKTSAYLDNILARRAALTAGADEAVLFNQYGRLAGAAAGNIFVQKGKQLITPPLSEGALAGIIRAALIKAGEMAGLSVKEGLIGRDLLAKADALFVTNSVQSVVPAGFDAAASEAQKKQGHALCEALPQYLDF